MVPAWMKFRADLAVMAPRGWGLLAIAGIVMACACSSSSSNPPSPPASDPDSRQPFVIAFDYRYDTRGFFADPMRKTTLEAAAKVWTSRFRDALPRTPRGLMVPDAGAGGKRRSPYRLASRGVA